MKGYKLKISGVMPADADNPNSILDAMKKIDAAEAALKDLGMTLVEITPKYVNNITLTQPELPGVQHAASPDNGVAAHA